jgi:hypothetical protein
VKQVKENTEARVRLKGGVLCEIKVEARAK